MITMMMKKMMMLKIKPTKLNNRYKIHFFYFIFHKTNEIFFPYSITKVQNLKYDEIYKYITPLVGKTEFRRKLLHKNL